MGEKKWLTIGMVVDATRSAEEIAGSAQRIIGTGKGNIIVVILLAGRSQGSSRKMFLDSLQTSFRGRPEIQEHSLHILDPPMALYPQPPLRLDNVDYALLAEYAA